MKYIRRAILQQTVRFREVLKEVEVFLEQIPQSPILQSQSLQPFFLCRSAVSGMFAMSVVIAGLNRSPGHVCDLDDRLGHLESAMAFHLEKPRSRSACFNNGVVKRFPSTEG